MALCRDCETKQISKIMNTFKKWRKTKDNELFLHIQKKLYTKNGKLRTKRVVKLATFALWLVLVIVKNDVIIEKMEV